MVAPTFNTPAGSIGTVNEGFPFSFAISFSGSPNIILAIIAGSLPAGLSIDNLGNISGTASLEPATQTYNFTIRLTNGFGFADRTFSILVNNHAPTWTDPNNLGTYPPESSFDYSFFVNNPGGATQFFEKISGTLPPGIFLNDFGHLYGIIEEVVSTTVFTFTVRAILDTVNIIDRTFTITVDPTASAAPVWLTPSGLLGEINQGNFGSFQVIAEDPSGGSVTYSAVGLPANLSINPATGLISGILASNISQVYTFSVVATSGLANSSRLFILNANKTVLYPINWITPEGSIGQIKEGDKSLLGVQAASTSPWIRYEIVTGSLPVGLTMDINTGNIWGLAQEQETVDTTFNFQVKAYNENTTIFGNFSLVLVNAYVPGATRVYASLFGNSKLIFIDLFTTQEIMIGNDFRDGDPQFGLIDKPKILIAENIDHPSADTVASTLAGVRRTYLNFGKVLVGQAVIGNEVVYEVLYRKIYDDFSGALEEYIAPVTGIDTKPGSLKNIRTRLLALGSSGGNDNLPLWMQSPQTIGDNSTIPGWTPCLEFAYIKPGLGQGIANKINANDVQLKKLYNNRIRIDRFIMEPAADNTFSPQYILFDNQY